MDIDKRLETLDKVEAQILSRIYDTKGFILEYIPEHIKDPMRSMIEGLIKDALLLKRVQDQIEETSENV